MDANILEFRPLLCRFIYVYDAKLFLSNDTKLRIVRDLNVNKPVMQYA